MSKVSDQGDPVKIWIGNREADFRRYNDILEWGKLLTRSKSDGSNPRLPAESYRAGLQHLKWYGRSSLPPNPGHINIST